MKVVSSSQMASLEALAYKEGSSEEDFMEEAGRGIAQIAEKFASRNHFYNHFILVCGKGNNGGDVYVAGNYLLQRHHLVTAYQIGSIKEASNLCKKNYERFLSSGGKVQQIEGTEELQFPNQGIIIDGIFGTGFHGIVKEPYASLINSVNKSGLPVLSVDIPSGVNGDTGIVEGPAIKAYETIFLALPKVGFFLQDGWNHVGKLSYVDFGLPQKYIDGFNAQIIMITPKMVKPLMPPIVNNRHKYQRGFVVGLAGSPGMPGASLLSSLSALRGGAGIVKLLHPVGMEAELALSPYELIKLPYKFEEENKVIELLNTAKAVFIGPGLGKTESTRKLLHAVFANLDKPCVIDADALTIISEDKITIPQGSLLTPHIGEMIRLLKLSSPRPSTMEFLETCQEYVEKKQVTLVLKGGPTFILHPGESIVVNPFGDPGMATAGSGDVLTGLLAALIAQGVSPHQAAILGVFLHGVAGEYAALEKSSYNMIASDIINHLPDAFKLTLQI